MPVDVELFISALIKVISAKLFTKTDKIKINDKDLFIVDEVSLHYVEKSDSK